MHNIKKRLVSAFLLFAMALSFYPSAFAANESQIDTATSSTVTSKVDVDSSTSSSVTSKADDATDADDSTPTNTKKDIANLFLCARPTLGNNSPQGWQYASFFTWIMRTTDSEQLVPAESAKDIQIKGFCKNAQGGISNDYEVRLKYVSTKTADLPYAPIAAKGNGVVDARITIDQNMKDATVYYIQAQLYDKDLKRVIDTKMLTVNVQVTHKKQNSVGYHRVGMQVYDIDGVPFGPYDYTASQTEYVKNTKGIMTSGGTALYTAMDGKQYGNCYFDIEYASDGLEAGYGITSESLANAYAFIAKNYMTSNKAKLDRTTGSIKLEGPAYVECQGLGSTQRYNMAYYKPSQTTGINSYADWAEQSRYRDFIDYRKQSIVIPLKQTGGISVNYYDIDTGAQISAPTTITTDEFKDFDNSQDAFAEYVSSVAAAYSPAYQAALKNCGIPLTDTNLVYASDFKKAAATWVFDKKTNKLVENPNSKVAEIREIITQRENMINGEGTGLMKNSATAPYFGAKKVGPKAISGYMFDCGYGYDALAALGYGSAMFVTGDNYKNATVVVNSKMRSAVVNLYYKAYGPTKYSVKLRINGTINEKYTKTYPGVVDQVVKESDVDKSIVPPGYTINKVENTPLTLVRDPAKNIIIIDVTAPMGAYKVEYYLDGKLKESATYDADIGTTIKNPPLKGYDGYWLDKISGTPLTVVDKSGVIRVYYVKNNNKPLATGSVKLFKDEYRTALTSSKSGYGAYGLFYVDVSKYVNAKSYPRWTVNGGCSPANKSKTVNTYKNIAVTATATWKEGLPLTKANKNGKQVTVNMIKDSRSTSTVWVFRLPNNSGSPKRYAKAYIPINWKNKTNWTVTCKATVSFDHYYWTTTTERTHCGGHSSKTGRWYHHYTIFPLKEWYTHESATITASKSVYVNGNMYQDDFTGSGKKH